MDIMKGNKLGRRGGSGSQEQPRREIMKKNKRGRQGGSGSQDQPRREIMKVNMRGRQGGSGRQEQHRTGNHEERQAWETMRQRPAWLHF